MKVAIVHDWFVGGGAERVVAELAKMYPEAPIYTAYCSKDWQEKLGKVRLRSSYMQAWPFSRLRKFLPILRAIWFSRLDLSDFDLVISSSGAEAKAVKVSKPAIHINYCHAPTHYYWSRYEEYMNSPGFGWLNPLARLGLRILVGPMRRWDYKAAQGPDYLVANSSYISGQIKKYYGRDSVVIHPPVEIEKFKPKGNESRSGFLIAGRQTPYKRFDLAIKACSKLDLPLIVVGNGPEHTNLRKIAGPSVKFTGRVSDEQLVDYLQGSKAFIFPGLDDFGIAPVEALAAGSPVIAFRGGGALDYVNVKTGVFFDEQSIASLTKVLSNFDSSCFDQADLISTAKQFSPKIFQTKILDFVNSLSKG